MFESGMDAACNLSSLGKEMCFGKKYIKLYVIWNLANRFGVQTFTGVVIFIYLHDSYQFAETTANGLEPRGFGRVSICLLSLPGLADNNTVVVVGIFIFSLLI